MIETDKPNPFRVLGLPTSADTSDVTERGQELVELAETEQEELRYRWAMEQLITNASTRSEYEIFEVPDADYDRDDWDRFCRSYQRNPVKIKEVVEQQQPPAPEDFDVSALIDLVLEALLEMPQADLKAAVDNSPFEPGIGPLPLEVRDVVFG